MPKFNFHQNSFRAGEISPKMYGRTDIDAYRLATKRQKNFIGYPQGGAFKRFGSYHVTDKLYTMAPHPNTANRSHISVPEKSMLIPFELSNGEKYQIVLTTGNNGYFRAINARTKEQTTIQNTGHVNAIGVGNYFSALPYFDGFASDIDFSRVHYAQKNDILVVVHPDYPPFRIQPRVVTAPTIPVLELVPIWQPAPGIKVANLKLGEWLPYQNLNITGITLAVSATTQFNSVTVTASGSLFTSAHIGVVFAVNHSGVYGSYVITAVTDPVTATALILDAPSATTATDVWYEGAWSNLRGWPKTVCFFNGRSMYGGNLTFSDTVWGSEVGDIFQLTIQEQQIALSSAITNSSPFSFSLDSEKLADVQWMISSSKAVVVGTKDLEFIIYGPDTSQSIGALNFQASPETSYGSKPVQAVRVDGRPIFVQSSGQEIRDLYFNRDQDNYISSEITFLSEHFPRKSQAILPEEDKPSITRMAFQQNDSSIVWCIDSNGYIFGFTRDVVNGSLSFHDHKLGGESDVEFPRVLSISAIQSGVGSHDELWMVVKRTINDVSKITIEYFGAEFSGESLFVEDSKPEKQPIFMDSCRLLKNVSPAFFASFSSSINADYAEGSVTGTGVGSPGASSGLNLSGGTVKYVTFDGTSNFEGDPQRGCIRFLLKVSEIDVIPATEFTLFSISQASGSANNLIKLDIDVGLAQPFFKLTINNSAGAAIVNDVTMGDNKGINFLMSQDEFAEIELNYDLTLGEVRLFVNGALQRELTGVTGTRSSAIDLLVVGSDRTGTNSSDGIFKDFQFYDSVQHTEEYAPLHFYSSLVSDNIVENLNFFEGETIQVVGNGNYLGTFVVTGGEIDLAAEYDYILLGYGYLGQIETVSIQDGAAIGAAQGSIKRIDRAAMQFFRSAQASIGPTEDLVELLPFRDPNEPMDNPIGLFTGEKTKEFSGDWDRQVGFYLEASAPLPCSITSVTLRGVTSD